MKEMEYACDQHIKDAPALDDFDATTHIYWVRVTMPKGLHCEFAPTGDECGSMATWACYSRDELSLTGSHLAPAPYVATPDDTHDRLVEILELLRAQQQGNAMRLQLKSSTTKGGLEGYEVSVSGAVTESDLVNAFDAAKKARQMILAELLAPFDPQADA